jgi:8-oxo-dGTP pyrophosphatase MutT (NUDIX family)
MAQIYRIYLNDTVLLITQSLSPGVENYESLDPDTFSFIRFFKETQKLKKTRRCILLSDEPRKLFRKIRKPVALVKAAGGLVKNEENKVLFIFRKGTWDLPKGKLDPGERTRAAAVREVEEECGIKVTSCGKKLCRTWHAYDTYGKITLKKTSWYLMKAFDQPGLVPQLEEEITEARWIAAGDFDIVKKNTYPLIRDVMAFGEE